MRFTEGRVVANGLDIAYLEAGTGPLALCLHGFPDSPASYRHLMPALAGAGYRAVAPFMRGYAPTAIPADGRYSSTLIGDDAIALHEALGGDEDAVIIGHDWGSVATWGAAGRAPQRWRRVVTATVPPAMVVAQRLFAPAQLKRSFYFWFFQQPVADMIVAEDDMAFLDFLWSEWSPGYDAAEDLRAVKDCLRDPANLAAALGIYRDYFNPATFPGDEWMATELASWGAPPEKPTLYLHGRQDGCVALVDEDLDTALEILPKGSAAEWVEGAGHFLIIEKPAEVNVRILEFLAAVD